MNSLNQLHQRRFAFLLFAMMLALPISIGDAASAAIAEAVAPVQSPGQDIAVALIQQSGMGAASPWYEAEKAHYRQVLARQRASVLLVPFQSQYYAVDRIERSLMTHYLADAIVSRSGMTVADLSLVERALGETQRRYNDQEVLAIADDIGADVIIRAYVGHRRDQKMVLTLEILQRVTGQRYSNSTPISRHEWSDIAFTDEHLPSDAFREMLSNVVKRLPFALRRADRPVRVQAKDNIDLPATPMDLVQNVKGLDPVDSAYRLQLLGALFPGYMEQGRERMFVRSLVALAHVDPRSPDYGPLRARALYYLNRRPAALKAIEGMRGARASELRTVLNGDLYELERLAAEIRSPLHAYLARIELFDLRWIYEVLPYMPLDLEAVASEDPQWKELVFRRLGDRYKWAQYSSLGVKKLLDDYFPVRDVRAEDIFASVLMLDPMDAREEIAQSVYRHVRESLARDVDRWANLSFDYRPAPLDLLFLFESLGIANVLREIDFELVVQGAPDRAMFLIGRYGPIYDGYPLFDFYHADALASVADKRAGPVRERLRTQAFALARRAYFLSGSQTLMSRNAASFLMRAEPTAPLYNGDFPRRSFWPVQIPESDRPPAGRRDSAVANAIVALDYETSNFSRLASLHEALSRLDDPLAAELIETNRDRFRGHPSRISYLGDLKVANGDEEGARRMYEQGVKDEPFNWNNYYALGLLHCAEGDYKRAAEIFLTFPPFTDREQRNKVGLSNWAYTAGMLLYDSGAIDEAVPLFSLSAGYQTGSGHGLRSAALLDLMRGRYAEAVGSYRTLTARYNDPFGAEGYISLLYAFGYTDMADSVLRSLKGRMPIYAVDDAVLTGLRRTNGANIDFHKTLQKDVAEFSEGSRPHLEGLIASHIALRLIDSKPTPESLSELETMYQNLALRLGEDGKIQRRHPYQDSWHHVGPDELTGRAEGDSSTMSAAKSDFAYFVDGYLALLEQDWEAATRIFDERGQYYSNLLSQFRYALPYVVRAGLKTGRLDAIETYQASHMRKREDVNGYVARAMVEEHKGNTEAAISMLRKGMSSYRPASTIFDKWYLLVEAAEWLYEDSGREDYRRLILEWAKAHQRVKPTIAWAYAAEAKYSESPDDRLRALAIALYLDAGSRRLTTVSEAEREQARQWLDRNNPFLLNRPEKSSVGI